MSRERGMAGQCGRLLRVHVGIGERLRKRAAPAVEVDWQSVRGLLEQLPLPRRKLPAALELARLGVPGIDAEGAHEVAPERFGVAHLALRLAGTLAASRGEHGAARGATVALPPVPKDAPEHLRHLEQLRALGLLARSPAPLEAARRHVERAPVERVKIPRAEPSEAAGDASHRLAL